MFKMRIAALCAAAALTATALTMMVKGDEKTYDPENDPVISLSYLNGVFAPTYNKKIDALTDKIEMLETTLNLLQNANTSLTDRIAALERGGVDTVEPEDTVEPDKTDAPEEPADEISKEKGYEVVYLTEGTSLMALSPCEIILRSGTATVISATPNGINDLSDGTELLNEAPLPLYHLTLVPRGGDGRGILITSADAYVMVRGDYETVE